MGPVSPAAAHLLAVDDDELVRTVLVRHLEQLGYRATGVADAESALAALGTHGDILLMLTDIRLGHGADGYRLAQDARARHPELLVIYMSGLGDDAAPEGALEAPVLSKPFRPGELAAVLADSLP
jgi:CheY-like chemotaxis protein